MKRFHEKSAEVRKRLPPNIGVMQLSTNLLSRFIRYIGKITRVLRPAVDTGISFVYMRAVVRSTFPSLKFFALLKHLTGRGHVIRIPAAADVYGNEAAATKEYVAHIYNVSGIPRGKVKRGNITAIHENAFDNCTSLDIVSLPKTLKHIGKEAFYKCDSLSEVVFPQDIWKIPAACCFSCRSLKRVVILSEWHSTSIEKSAFGGCEDLQEVVLDKDVFYNNISEFKRMTNYANIRFVSLDNKLLSEA